MKKINYFNYSTTTSPIASLTALVALSSLGIAGCGGGGSSSQSTPPPPVAQGNYVVYGISDAGILLVNPSDPAKRKTIAGQFAPVEVALDSATVDETTGKIQNLKRDTLLVSQNGELMRLALAIPIAGTEPALVKVSSESAATTTCLGSNSTPFNGFATQSVANDYATPSNSRIVYILPGADGDCNTIDDEIKAIRADMSATDAPISAPVFDSITPLWDNKGKPIGWLAYVGDTIVRHDLDFTTPEPVTAASGTDGPNFGTARDKNGIGFGTSPYRYYNATAKTLSDPIAVNFGSFSAGGYYGATDDSHIYYHGSSATELGLFRRLIDGTEVGAPIVTDSSNPAGNPGFILGITTNHVVFRNGDGDLKSVAKSGGPISLIDDKLEWAGRGNRAPFLTMDNNLVVYERYAEAAPSLKTNVILRDVEADKDIQQVDDSTIIGEVAALDRPGTVARLQAVLLMSTSGIITAIDFATDTPSTLGTIDPLGVDEFIIVDRGGSDDIAIATRSNGATVTGVYLFDLKKKTITKLL
jgi:hypothetical protein